MMDDMIRGLDDSQAVRVLTTFARVRLAPGRGGDGVDAGTRSGLAQVFPAEADAGRAASVSEGDLARQAAPPGRRPAKPRCVTAPIAGPPPDPFEVVGAGTVALFAATLVVLQFHVLFERDKDGKIHIKREEERRGGRGGRRERRGRRQRRRGQGKGGRGGEREEGEGEGGGGRGGRGGEGGGGGGERGERRDREEADPGQPAEGSRAEAVWFFHQFD